MHRRPFLWLTAGLLLTSGCAPSGPPRNPADPPPKQPPPPRGALWRHEVVAVVDAGLGRFLRFVPVQPVVREGRFIGFRILDLRPRDAWQHVDLQVGDVVTQVNGRSIARDNEALTAFRSLRSASKLRVRFLRDGEERLLEYRIVEQPGIVIPPEPKGQDDERPRKRPRPPKKSPSK